MWNILRIQRALVLTNMVSNEFLVISNKISRSLSFLTMKTLIQNIDLRNNAFNEFLIISNKNVNHGVNKQYHILKLCSLFGNFDTAEFLMHTAVPSSNSNIFIHMPCRFKLRWSYITVVYCEKRRV